MEFETTVKEIIQRTSNVTSFRFPRPAELDYKPGQFFLIKIKSKNNKLSKYFSFSSSPTEKEHIEFTKKLSDSEFSSTLKIMKVGDGVKIQAPFGQFTFEGEYPKIALLGGGIGITPFRSICRNATDKGLDSKITLFYGCSTPEDFVFKDEFEALSQKNKNLKVIFAVSRPTAEWKGITGRISAEMIKQELPDFEKHIFYACGPPPMVKGMESIVESLGVAKAQLKSEYFAGYT